MNNPIALLWIRRATWWLLAEQVQPDFPNVNSAGIKDVLKGGYDIILTKINSTGTTLIGSRIIGGTGMTE